MAGGAGGAAAVAWAAEARRSKVKEIMMSANALDHCGEMKAG
jgi:hypothetical protein